LLKFRAGLLKSGAKGPVTNAGVRAGGGRGLPESDLIEMAGNYRKNGDEARFRWALDQLSERGLKKGGFDKEFVKHGPGVTLPRATAEALMAAAGKGGRPLGGDMSGSVNPALMLALSKGALAGTAGGVYGWNQDENASVEERMAKALLYGAGGFVLGAGGGYALGRQLFRPAARAANRAAAGAAGGAPDADEAALRRWQRRLEPVKPEKKGGSVLNVAREKLGNAFAAVDELERAVEKAGGAVTSTHGVRLSQQLQNTRGMTAMAAQEVNDYAQEVVRPLSREEREALSVLTALKRGGQRIAQDEADAARAAGMMAMDPAALSKEDAAWLRAWAENPNRRRIAKGDGGYETLDDVNAALRGLRRKIGDKMFDKLDQVAAGPFQQAADRAVRVLVEAGVVSKEAYAAMKAANDFYAPYKVIHEADYEGNGMGRARLIKRKDSDGDIALGHPRMRRRVRFKIVSPTRVLAQGAAASRRRTRRSLARLRWVA
jgi:hypothetical protein